MKIKIKKFILTSISLPLTPVVFNLDDYTQDDRVKLENVFSKTLLHDESLDSTDMRLLLEIGELSFTSKERDIIERLEGLFYTLVAKSNDFCRVTCEWEAIVSEKTNSNNAGAQKM